MLSHHEFVDDSVNTRNLIPNTTVYRWLSLLVTDETAHNNSGRAVSPCGSEEPRREEGKISQVRKESEDIAQ